MGETKRKLDDDIDSLFKLPLAEFTGARNTLAAQLKKTGRRDEAERIKLLGKPSISAWAVNQLYWLHRDAFNQLIATSKSFRQGQKSGMRDSLNARREALAELSDLATGVLVDAGHNPGLDTLRRVTTTLEALSAYALLPDGPTPGRLTQDVDPPSFEALASLMSGAGAGALAETRTPSTPSRKSSESPQKAKATVDDARRVEAARQAKIAAAKAALQEAKKLLSEARATAQSLEATQKKVNADAKEAEKHRREAAERLEKATAAAEFSARRAQSVAAEAKEASKALEEARRAVEKSTKELELLFEGGA